MRFQSKTEQQIDSEELTPEGWHEAEVTSAEEKTSKTGNPMIEIRLKVYTPNGERTMRDWMLPTFPRKLKHFCDAAGLESEYTLGCVEANHCTGKVVMVEVKHTEGKGEYAGRTNANANDYKKVERVSAARSKPAPKPMPANVEISPDDIPF
jgi:hypothetical protein